MAIKEASDSADRLVNLAALSDSIDMYAGNDSQIYTTLSLGGKGVISVISNLLPRYTHRICESFLSGNRAGALKMQTDILPLIKALFTETNPAPIKYAMSLLGYSGGELRLPLCEVRESTKEILKKEIEAILPLVDKN